MDNSKSHGQFEKVMEKSESHRKSESHGKIEKSWEIRKSLGKVKRVMEKSQKRFAP